MNELHSLLKRQLRRFKGEAQPFLEEQTDLLQAINDAYSQFDADRKMLEHSLELTSQELLEVNAELSKRNVDLEMRVAARTAELERSETLFRALFDLSPDAILVIDPHDSNASWPIIDCNMAACIMNGYQRHELIGQSIDILNIKSGTEAERIEYMKQLREAGNLKLETQHRHKNGVIFPVEISTTLIMVGERELVIGIDRDITERKLAEEKLGASEAELRALFGAMLDVVIVFNREGRYVQIAPTSPELLYKSPNEMLGKTVFDVLPQALAQTINEAIQEVLRTRKLIHVEYPLTTRGEGEVWKDAIVSPLTQDTVFWIARDITDRKQAEAALAAERDLLQALMDNIPDSIYFKDTASRFTRINRAQAKLLGVVMPEEAIGKTDLDFQNPNLAQGFYEEEQRLVQTGEAVINRIEFNPTPGGQPRWLSTTKVPIKDEAGRVISMVGVSHDITQLRQAEDALREAELKYRMLVENIPAIIYVDLANESRNTVYISSHIQEMLGYSPEDWIAKPDLCNEIVHPEDSERMWKEAQESEAYGRFACDYRYIAKDGHVVWVHDVAILLKNEAGEPSSWQGVMLDITAQKEAEEALRQSEERFKLIAWATKDAVWDWDMQTNQIWWGDGLQKIFHYSSETTQTNPAWRLEHIYPEDRAKVNRAIDQALEGGMEFWSKEYRFQRVDGTYADIMDRGYVIRNEAGKTIRMIGAMMDITERRQSEETIRHQNEMLSSLHQMTLDLLRYREVDELLDALVKLSAKFLDAPYAEIMLVEGEMLVVKAATQSQPRSIGERVRRDGALLSWQAFDTHAPAVLSDYANWPNRQATYDNFPLHAVADFPILNDDRCLGVLSLGRHEPDYEFNLDQIQFGRLFANLTALVLNNAQLREALREQSIRDPLTELYNRRYMEEALFQQLSRVTRQLLPLGLIMIDIDHFKNFNDTHGHAAGDALLRELGQFLKNHVRNEDIACRYGGEEFLLIMPDASLEAAHQRAVLLQQEAKKLRVQDAGQSLEGITLSLGVAIYPEHGRSVDSLLRAADAALYRAKQEGRDRVVVAERAR